MPDSRWRRALVLLFPALLPPLQLFLFGPHTLYSNNQQEFSAPFWNIGVHLVPAIFGVTSVLVFVGVALPERLFRHYVAGLVGVGIVLWIQGNLIVADYGVLNGEDIDWSSHAWRNRYEPVLWVALPALLVVFARRLFPTAVFASRVLVALQIVLLAVTAAKADPDARAKWEGPPDAIFEVSSKQNVFHFVLDGFQSDVFLDIVEADRAEMDRRFSGFTFFANHSGAFPTTIVSIPAMLTGQVYRNQEPMRRFMNRHFKRASIFGVMRSQGYQVDAISGLQFDKASATNYYRLPTPYVSYDAYVRFTAWQLADLSLFRHSPHLLKPAIYNGQSWRLQNMFGQDNADTAGRRHLPVNGEAFLRDFTPRLRVGHDRPLYKYVHVGVPHWPMTLDADCNYIGVKRASRELYSGQARCAVKRVAEFLDRLRELGLYDSSMVVISSDHGVALPPDGFTGDRDIFGGPLSNLSGSALALLVVKPPQANGPVRISQAPTTISDIPATIVDTMGLKNPFGGTPAMKVDETAPRPRAFAVYPWSSSDWYADHFPHMDVFTIDGSMIDGQAWKTEDPIYAPGIDVGGRSRGFYRPERGGPGITFRWSGGNAYLHAPPDAKGLELMVRSAAPTPQTLTVEIRGTVVDTRKLTDHEWHTLRYQIPPRPAGAESDNEWVVMRVDPIWRPRGDGRRLGVMTRDLKWSN
ncbi:MAG: hypothetical protein EHM55_03985 [Acidobacteria bacterium]|nr:MAG: hypothetical protein EHM55_03985 [Acidobacteriota bacterium]